MSNQLSAYQPTFYAQEALLHLEKALGMATRVHRGYDAERRSASIGQSISIRRPSGFSTQPGGAGAAPDLSADSVSITLDNWREVKFAITDKELAYGGQRLVDEHIAPAAYALAAYVDLQLTGLAARIPWAYDCATPATEADILGGRKILRNNAGALVDLGNVHFAIDPELEAAFLSRDVFHSAAVAGALNSQDALLRGSLGVRFGVEHFVNQNLPSHASGTLVSAGTDTAGALNGAHAKGAGAVSLAGFTGAQTLAAGDSFAIAGHAQRYSVAADAALTDGANASVPVFPALVQDYETGALVTFENGAASGCHADSYAANVLFHRNAFALAFAPLPEIGDGAGANMSVITDPKSGISIRSRLAYIDATATVNVTLDVLFGAACLDPNLAVILRRAK
jgi:hypothetical protein